MSTPFIFPDNTVLINFTLVGRQDLVEWLVRDNGKWCVTVARECKRSAEHKPELYEMRQWDKLFGKPLHASRAELLQASVIASRMHIPGLTRRPGEHMGEAETIAIIDARRKSPAGGGKYDTARFLTDDHGAARVASEFGIESAGSAWIIAMAQVCGRLTPMQAEEIRSELNTLGRVLRIHNDWTGTYEEYVKTLMRNSNR